MTRHACAPRYACRCLGALCCTRAGVIFSACNKLDTLCAALDKAFRTAGTAGRTLLQLKVGWEAVSCRSGTSGFQHLIHTACKTPCKI